MTDRKNRDADGSVLELTAEIKEFLNGTKNAFNGADRKIFMPQNRKPSRQGRPAESGKGTRLEPQADSQRDQGNANRHRLRRQFQGPWQKAGRTLFAEPSRGHKEHRRARMPDRSVLSQREPLFARNRIGGKKEADRAKRLLGEKRAGPKKRLEEIERAELQIEKSRKVQA